jgi:hypothetical protein
MKTILVLAVAIALTGCATTRVPEKVEPTVASRVEYVIRIPPVELLDLPKPPPSIDVDKATQADVARWIAANEKWFNDVQNRFSEVAKFLRDEQKNLDKLAKDFNEKQGTSGDAKLVIKREEPKK